MLLVACAPVARSASNSLFHVCLATLWPGLWGPAGKCDMAVSVQVTYTNNYVNPPTDSFPGVVNLVSGATCRAARPSAPAPAPPPGRPGPRLPPLRAIERARSTVSHAHMCEACKHGVTRQLVLTCTRAPAGGSSKVSGIFYGARASFMCLSWFACFSLHNSRQCMVA